MYAYLAGIRENKQITAIFVAKPSCYAGAGVYFAFKHRYQICACSEI